MSEDQTHAIANCSHVFLGHPRCAVCGQVDPRINAQPVIDKAEKLRAAIAKHHSQKADDRCWLDDEELYAAAGLAPADRHVGDKAAMLKNCERFLKVRCQGGRWPSYVEVEDELTSARERIYHLESALKQLIFSARQVTCTVKDEKYQKDLIAPLQHDIDNAAILFHQKGE